LVERFQSKAKLRHMWLFSDLNTENFFFSYSHKAMTPQVFFAEVKYQEKMDHPGFQFAKGANIRSTGFLPPFSGPFSDLPALAGACRKLVL
jgi:hypothetical protein